MRLLHVSDTHVGFSAYSRVTPEGLNQREQDFFLAFKRAIDLALEERVDVVLHSGDVFDSVRPTNRAVTWVMEQVRRLADADIPFVAIAGNHETPKLRETGSVLRFLDFLPNTHAVYKGRYEKVRIGDIAFHCVPHAPDEPTLHAELERVEKDPDAKWDVLTFHAGVIGVADFKGDEFNEQNVPMSMLRRDMDYVALGHYHKPTELQKNAYYAGSTERTSFREAAEAKGCNLVDLAAGTVEFRDLAAREMVTLPAVKCRNLPEIEIATRIYRTLAEADIAGKIARLKVLDVPRHVYASLDFQRIRKLSEAALHCRVHVEVAPEDGVASREEATIGSLTDEFEGFFSEVPVDGVDRERVRKRAVAFIEDAVRAGAGEGAQ